MRNVIFITILSLSHTLQAQIINDLDIYPPPAPPALPAAGETLIDPTFGTEILRVTDESDGAENTHGYSYWQCFNADNSYLYVYSEDGVGKFYDLDTASFSISNKRDAFNTLIDGEYPLGEDQIWSPVDKNIIYAHTYKNLAAYNAADDTYTIIKNFDGFIPNNEYLWQMSMNVSATKFAFSRKRMSDYNITGYVVYDATVDSVYVWDDTEIDEVHLDKTGEWLWVSTDNQGAGVIQTHILNLATGLFEDLTDNEPDYAPGHGDVGHNFIIGADNWENRLLYRTCDNPHTYYSVWNFESDWSQDVHVSQLAENEDWVLISCYLTIDDFPFSGLLENEILQVSTDGKMNVRRLCHHQSNYLISGDNYWASPRASISRDGRFVIFTSNWGNPDRTDVFLLKIPAAPGGEDTTLAIPSIAENEVRVFPNPASEFLNLHISSEKIIQSIKTFTVFGNEIELLFDDEFSADVSKLADGIYFTELQADDFRKTVSWVKE